MATPDKPSQSSSNGSKNGSGDNTVAFIVIAAIVVLAVQYFLTGTSFALDIWEEFTAPELSNAEIAQRLYVSPSTVKAQLSSIQDKLGVDNRVLVAVLVTRARS